MTNSTNPHPPGPVSEALAACAHAINRFHLAYTRARDAEDQCEVRRGPGYKPPRPPAHDLQIGEVRGHDGLLLWRQARADAHRARRAMDDVGRDACDRISAAGAAARALELDAKDLDDLLELLDQITGRITARNIPHATEHDQGYHDLHSKFARWRRRIARYERLLPSSQDAAGSPADTGGCTTTIDRTGEKILNVLAELPAAVCQSLVSAPPAEQPGATIEPDATVPARTAAPVIDAEAKPAPLEQPLPPCQLTAHQSYVRAHENNSELKGATLPEVHTWLSKHDPDPDYQLPRFQTWGRYIRAVKRHRRGCPANAPRAGRAHGSSIASHDQVSDRRIPTG